MLDPLPLRVELELQSIFNPANIAVCGLYTKCELSESICCLSYPVPFCVENVTWKLVLLFVSSILILFACVAVPVMSEEIVLGNLPSLITPDEILFASKFVRLNPFPLKDPAVNRLLLGLYAKLPSTKTVLAEALLSTNVGKKVAFELVAVVSTVSALKAFPVMLELIVFEHLLVIL